MGLIDSASNGATEVPGTSADATFVFLASPIRGWWAPGMWESPLHVAYTSFRDAVHDRLSSDFLVYAPHRAWRGPWNEVAQRVNDAAVLSCHALVYLNVPGMIAEGTRSETELAAEHGIPTFRLDLSDDAELDRIITLLLDIDRKRSDRTTAA